MALSLFFSKVAISQTQQIAWKGLCFQSLYWNSESCDLTKPYGQPDFFSFRYVYCFITDLMICIKYTCIMIYIYKSIISWKLTNCSNCSWSYEEIWHYHFTLRTMILLSARPTLHEGYPWLNLPEDLMYGVLTHLHLLVPNDAIWKKTTAVVLEEVWNLSNGRLTLRLPWGSFCWKAKTVCLCKVPGVHGVSSKCWIFF